MSGKKIAEFLLSEQGYVHSNKKFREASRLCMTSGKLTVLNKLGNRELVIPNNNDGRNDMIEMNILNHKLKGAKVNKEGLSKRLELVDNSIENLGNLLELQRRLKKKKKWNKEIEDIKTEEMQKNIKKLILEQNERQKVLELREKEKNEKIELEEKLKQEELLRLEVKKNEEKVKRLQETKEKSGERKKYIEGIKELKSLKKKKLLHEKLAEDFEKNIIIPETQRIAEALSVRHKNAMPSMDELQLHIREHNKLIQSRSFTKHTVSYSESRRFTPSKFLQMITDEEELAKEMDKIKEAEKLDLIDRKNNYAKLVRQLYQPTLAKEPRQVAQATPVKRRVHSVTPTLKKSDRVQSKPKKTVKLEKPRELPKINYLEQRRGIRERAAEESLNSYTQSLDLGTLKQAKKLEERTKDIEIAIKHSTAADYNIAAEERLNNMLIDSVKAKLGALNKHA